MKRKLLIPKPPQRQIKVRPQMSTNMDQEVHNILRPQFMQDLMDTRMR